MPRSLCASLRSLRALDEAARVGARRAELDGAFDRLLARYLEHAELERKQLRRAYVRCEHWGSYEFWSAHRSYVLRFHERGREVDLRRALGHYSLTNGFPDARDAVLALSDMVGSARAHGVDWRPVFREIGAATDPDEDTGIGPLQPYFIAGPLSR